MGKDLQIYIYIYIGIKSIQSILEYNETKIIIVFLVIYIYIYIYIYKINEQKKLLIGHIITYE